jgi:GH25 family lysozyme M1 (1,4-beta-N-acetylmuramidase)
MAAAALVLAAAGGGSYAVIRAVSPPAGPELVAPAAQPSMAGQPATAAVPRGAGGVDAAGPGAAADGGPGPGAGQPAPGQGGTGTAGSAAPGAGVPPLSRSAGQGDPGPLPQGALPGDGAVPGASPAMQALAAARAATTALPHSPRLLAQLATAPQAGGASATVTSPAAAGTPAVTPAAETSAPSSSPAPPASSPAAPSPPAASPPAASPAGPLPAGPSTAPPVSSPAASGLSPAEASARAAAVAVAGPHALAGLDVAGFQHVGGAAINWSAVAAHGYKFAAVKATEGDYYVNPWAARDVASAKAAGLAVAPYHFAVPNASGGAAQAQFAVEYSGYKAGPRTLPLMLDIEYDPYNATDHANECYGLTAAAMTAWLSAFVTTARTLTGQYPVIYTTADWWDTCTGRSAAFGADPLWIAAYGFASPPRPAGWSIWTYWQYTSGGTVAGVPGAQATDLDVFSFSAVGLMDPGSQSARAGARVSLAVTSLGAACGETLAYSASGLPPGLSVSKGGTISGTIKGTGATAVAPGKSVTYRVTLSVKNAAAATAAAAFTWKVTPA